MLNISEIQNLVPQKYPFLMLDKVVDIEIGKSIKAYKNISINEEYFRGHFPSMPIFPGALTAEAMAQAACVLLKKSLPDLKASVFYVSNIKIRFFKPVVPGDRLYVTINTIKMTSIGGIFETEAVVGSEVVARGEMTFACK